MNTSAKFDILTLSEAELVDQACDRFETAWRNGDWPCIEGYLDAVAEPCRTILLHELLKLEIELRVEKKEQPTAQEYRLRFPDQAEAIDEIFRAVAGREKPPSTSPEENLEPDDPDRTVVSSGASTIGLDPRRVDELADLDGTLGRLLGDYLILERIGSGGMGVVHRALQRTAGRFVALKMIKADWWGESTDVTPSEAEIRFRNEAQALAQLEHDHIVPVYDVGHAAGILFFSMRLIKGRSLSQILLSDGPLPPRRAAYYMEAMARAVQYAHDHRILHRDVKPGNILVDENDRPLLIDLGLAKSLEATDFKTMSGRPLGTAEYMAPEQARGQKDVGFTADVYGLGATLFALLTGRPPFSGPNPVVVLRKVIDEEPVWPRERNKPVGRELKAICLKCLEKNPDKRFRSAGELAGVLNKYLKYEATGVVLPGPWTGLVKWVKRQPWRAAAAGLALTAVLVAAAALGWTAHRDLEVSEAFIRDLPTIPLSELPSKSKRMARHRGWVKPRLNELLPSSRTDSDSRTRILLALLPYEPNRANELADRLLTCEPEEHRVIRKALRDRWADMAPKLRQVVKDPEFGPDKRTRAAAALIALDGPTTPAGQAWSELHLAQDPGPRVELLDWLVRSAVSPDVLTAHLENELDPSVRLIVIQCLADVGGEQPVEASQAYLPRLLVLYRDDPDVGVHSSIAYLLRRWGHGDQVKSIDDELSRKPRGSRRWYVNSQGHTMAVIGGDHDLTSLLPLRQRLRYRFAIATTETTLDQYVKFDCDHRSKRDDHTGKPQTNPDVPADVITYNGAASYCNWVSKKEGLPQNEWCYLPDAASGDMVMAPDYLSRKGYRLPNLQEWEYAARAGTTTDRYFGDPPAHLARYAWSKGNTNDHAEPVGLKRPNDFGLFDVIGNLTEWCHNPDPPHNPGCPCNASQGKDCRKTRLVSERGGCFYYSDAELVAKPSHTLLDQRTASEGYHFFGFRIVKAEQ